MGPRSKSILVLTKTTLCLRSTPCLMGFPYSSVGKESAYNAGDPGSIPRLGESPEEGNGNPHQYSCLENPMDCSLPGSPVHGIARVRHDLTTKPQPMVESESESHSVVSDSLLPMDYTVQGILQARILEWVAISFSTRSSQPRNRTWVSCIVGGFFTN